jgi:hypothetical protein
MHAMTTNNKHYAIHVRLALMHLWFFLLQLVIAGELLAPRHRCSSEAPTVRSARTEQQVDSEPTLFRAKKMEQVYTMYCI